MLQSLKTLVQNRTTYRIGLLQAKAYRAMKNETGLHLEPFDLSTTEWGLLGLLLDTGGLSPSEAAFELGVEAPFVTAMTSRLKKKGWVQEKPNETDNRKKFIFLTKEGESFVLKTETHMRSAMRPLIDGVPARALADYLMVLGQILKNVQKK